MLGIDIAIPSFSYESSIVICRRNGLIRSAKATDGARFDGLILRDVVTCDTTSSIKLLPRCWPPLPHLDGLVQVHHDDT